MVLSRVWLGRSECFRPELVEGAGEVLWKPLGLTIKDL
jgi:hypothetical protein